MSWQDILDTEINPGKPPKSSIFYRLRDNLVAVAQRMVGAPVVQVPEHVFITAVGAGVWNIPDGVTAWTEELVGGGGGNGTGAPGAGGATTTTYDGLTVTAGGGSASTSGAGGTATNGDLNIPGQRGVSPDGTFDGIGGMSPYGSAPSVTGGTVLGYGVGAINGGAGARAIKRRVRVPGLDTVSYTVGAAGIAGSGPNAAAGAQGLLIIRY